MAGRRMFSIRSLHDYFWGFKLTPGGRIVVVAVLVAAIGSVTVEIPVYQIFCSLIALLMVAEPMGLLFRPVVELQGSLPEVARALEPITSDISVSNRSRRPVFDLTLSLFGLPPEVRRLQNEQFIPLLRPGESTVFPITLEARRRGFYRLPAVHAHSTFPFNLMRFGSCRLPEQSVTVLPVYHAIDHVDLPATERYQPGGLLFASGVGTSPEYVGNREYTPGEPLRRLDAPCLGPSGKTSRPRVPGGVLLSGGADSRHVRGAAAHSGTRRFRGTGGRHQSDSSPRRVSVCWRLSDRPVRCRSRSACLWQRSHSGRPRPRPGDPGLRGGQSDRPTPRI